MVGNLLKMESLEWDVDQLNDIFAEEDVRIFLKIPLSFSTHDDKWVWLEDSRGCYTVKSGYRLLRRIHF